MIRILIIRILSILSANSSDYDKHSIIGKKVNIIEQENINNEEQVFVLNEIF